MLNKRIIPILLIKNDQMVKSVEYKNLSYVGDPINIIKIFNEKEADEIIVLDIEKSTNDKELNYDLIRKFASECYMPLTYGGGIKNIKQAEKLFSLGIEKLVINSNNYKNINLIDEISEKFGSQSIVSSIDINRDFFNNLYLYDWLNKKKINLGINDHIRNCIDHGSGEILLNFVFNEGTLCGFKTDILNFINFEIPIPLIINGGINSVENIKKCIDCKKIDAIGVGSFFIYHGPHRAVLISYTSGKEKT